MDLENLSQFNKRLFKKFLGVYVQQRRLQFSLTVEQIAKTLQVSVPDFRRIESGQAKISQNLFDQLRHYLELDPAELVNMGRLTQVRHIMGVYKEIDEHYPR